MKKLVLLTLAAFALYTQVSGQLSLRPQVGINFASLSDDVLGGEWEGNVGYQFGVDLQIGGRIYVQPGVNFQSTSLTLKDVGDLDVSRINIPVLLGFKLFEHENGTFGIRGFLGPNFAINVNEDLDDAFADITKDNIKDSQISGLFGIGADISIIFVDIAYKIGLSDYFEDINADASNHIFIANAGVRIGF